MPASSCLVAIPLGSGILDCGILYCNIVCFFMYILFMHLAEVFMCWALLNVKFR